MNAFITSPPAGVLDASTALPTQIYIWADSPERGFVSRTSAAILVLLGFLLLTTRSRSSSGSGSSAPGNRGMNSDDNHD